MATNRVQLKIEQIARLRVGGMKDGRIAEIFQMTQSGLSRILATPEYHEAEQNVLNGTLTKLDEALAGKIDEIRTTYRALVPAAMRGLLDAVTQRRDLRAMLEASREILDRDPDKTFSKTKSIEANGVPTLPEAVLASASQESDKVSDAIKNAKPTTEAVQ